MEWSETMTTYYNNIFSSFSGLSSFYDRIDEEHSSGDSIYDRAYEMIETSVEKVLSGIKFIKDV